MLSKIKRAVLAFMALCMLVCITHGNHITSFTVEPDGFRAFQFYTIEDYWEFLGKHSHWGLIE